MALRTKSDSTTEANPWIFRDFPVDIPGVRSDLLPVDLDGDNPALVSYGSQGVLKLPDLETFHYGPLETIPVEDEPTYSEPVGDGGEVDNADLWISASSKPVVPSRKTRTWEAFCDKDFLEPTIYLSEATEAVWNAVWQRFDQVDHSTAGNVAIRRDYVVQSLLGLGLGLQSTLFNFDATGRVHVRSDITFSGLSRSLTMDIIGRIGSCGKSIRAIESSIKMVRGNSRQPQTMIAAISAITRIVDIIRQYILDQASEIATVLQVQALFQLPAMLLSKLQSAVEILLSCKDDVAVIKHGIELATRHENVDEWYYPLSLQILVLTIRPFLEQVSQSIGLLPADHSIPRTALLGDLSEHDAPPMDTASHKSKLSDLFDEDQGRSIFAIYKSLDLLKIHQPEHTLPHAKRPSHAFNSRLELAVSWEDIARIRENAVSITKDENHSSGGITSSINIEKEQRADKSVLDLDPYCSDRRLLLQKMLQSVEIFDSIHDSRDRCHADRLSQITNEILYHESYTSSGFVLQAPLQMLMLESFTPLLSAQSHIINRACLDMIFKDHGLMHNLDVLYQFHLLGSGIFTTKLKEALFSTDLSSTERKKGYHRAGQLGLQLNTRSTWPPASAELRLALTGILSDCYQTSLSFHNPNSSNDLPGNLSFAIRNLSDPEIEACMNPKSLAALDFLRLQYQPPKALNSIITDPSLEKYDQIFRFLLRLARVSFAVNQIWLKQRNTTPNPTFRYTHEIHHFISELTSHVHTAIATTWIRFRRILVNIRSQLTNPSDKSTSTSLFHLSAIHDLFLDKIMADLLLRHRHDKARKILDQILTIILQFAFASDSSQVQVTFAGFREQVKLFVIACRHIAGRERGQQNDSGLSTELRMAWDAGDHSVDGLQGLLLGLDFNGRYSVE